MPDSTNTPAHTAYCTIFLRNKSSLHVRVSTTVRGWIVGSTDIPSPRKHRSPIKLSLGRDVHEGGLPVDILFQTLLGRPHALTGTPPNRSTGQALARKSSFVSSVFSCAVDSIASPGVSCPYDAKKREAPVASLVRLRVSHP